MPGRRNKRATEAFPTDSIAGFVFERPSTVPEAVARPVAFTPGSIAAVVFGGGDRRRRRRVVATLMVAFALTSAIAWAAPAQRPRQSADAEIESVQPTKLEYVVELKEPVAEPPAPPEPASKAAKRVVTRKRLATPDAPGAKPPPPAQAGKLVAANEPTLDFTEASFVSGEAVRFAGGVTAPSGTNTDAVRTSTVDPNAEPGGPQGEGSLARTVSLSARDWNCPWPEEARMLGIDEQIVVIRALVDADGVPQRVSVLADPGHGFGNATLECAKSAKFQPACDRDGKPYTATSPPIRVRFTR